MSEYESIVHFCSLYQWKACSCKIPGRRDMGSCCMVTVWTGMARGTSGSQPRDHNCFKMSKFHLLALLMGVLLVSAPFTSTFASEDADDDEEEAGDVVVLTTENFDEIVSKSKFALVRFFVEIWSSPCPFFTNYARRSSFMHRGAVIARYVRVLRDINGTGGWA